MKDLISTIFEELNFTLTIWISHYESYPWCIQPTGVACFQRCLKITNVTENAKILWQILFGEIPPPIPSVFALFCIAKLGSKIKYRNHLGTNGVWASEWSEFSKEYRYKTRNLSLVEFFNDVTAVVPGQTGAKPPRREIRAGPNKRCNTIYVSAMVLSTRPYGDAEWASLWKWI